ncbi:RnfABCDGE type electron transport complex subunit B [Methylibium sp.]|uniref:RnfABCDGE type electron transport complex subunit B n=1 Tax=Methylibium sp. TaxID=2067992 RepID=UPI00286A7720|nr:RnfABCDGE type electron transport complex subunit B [Methylibium sp.]
MNAALAELIDAALPQTQCTRCGEPDCRRYAQAIAEGRAEINRCPPGGAEGIARLATLTGRASLPLDPACGIEGPLRLAVIDEAWCIGCTLCIKACPVDCIVGAAKQMHTVIESHCTGCELCLPVCPVDCIAMMPAQPGAQPPTGWAAWSSAAAEAARTRYAERCARASAEAPPAPAEHEPRSERIAAALARARGQRTPGSKPD